MYLHRRVSSSGVVYYASPLMEAHQIPHAFSTRIGGISPPPFNSMNLGNPSGCAVQDQNERITENYHRLMQAIGCENRPRFYLHQIHGNVVGVVDGPDFSNAARGDALVTCKPGCVLSVRIADCCPVLIATPDGRVVAAIHAGWRGAVGGVINAAVSKMVEIAGVDPSTLIAAVGPCIGINAFEVGPEVLAEFESVFGNQAPLRRTINGKGFVDLATSCQLQLSRCGIRGNQVDVAHRCTFTDADEFFSHRRDNGITGRMSALIASR